MIFKEWVLKTGIHSLYDIPTSTFKKLVDAYESIHSISVDFIIDNTAKVYICGETGEILHTESIPKYMVIELPKLCGIAMLEIPEQVEEIMKHNSGYKIEFGHTTLELFTMITSRQSKVLHVLMDNLVRTNYGVVDRNLFDLTPKHLVKVIGELENSGYVKRINNPLKNSGYITYEIAPYIAFKGNQGQYENCLQWWFISRARNLSEKLGVLNV